MLTRTTVTIIDHNTIKIRTDFVHESNLTRDYIVSSWSEHQVSLAEHSTDSIRSTLVSLGWTPPGPINGILHCPACGEQHIDAPETQPAKNGEPYTTWNNPPHKSHLCAHCGHIWRPFDVPTNGVQDTVTHGADDHQKPVHAKGLTITDMVQRFLGWRLPSNFSPDGGISFDPVRNHVLWPTGTNLFAADQALRMLEYVLDIKP